MQLKTGYGDRNMFIHLGFRLLIHTQLSGRATADINSSVPVLSWQLQPCPFCHVLRMSCKIGHTPRPLQLSEK